MLPRAPRIAYLPARSWRAAAAVLLAVFGLLPPSPAGAASAPTAAAVAEQARLAAERGDLRSAAEAYRKASLQNTPLADEYRLSAAEAALALAEPALVEPFVVPLLAPLSGAPLDRTQQLRWQIANSRAARLRGRSFDALRALPAEGTSLPASLAATVEALRAEALFALGDPLAATRALVQRERDLGGDPARIAENHDQIWNGLVATPLSEEARRLMPLQDPMTRGWLELAWLMQQGSADFATWRRLFPGHPAEARIASIRSGQQAARLAFDPGRYRPSPGGAVALLLPLSGALATGGAAIGDGFLAGHFASGESDPAIRFYDAGSTPEQAVSAYRQALADGAVAVVGPLQKEAVTAVARLGTPPVAVVALNTLEAGFAPPGLLQLGLNPEDEVAAAAAQAASEGRLRALALVPEGDWGRRVLASFERELSRLGGRVVENARYVSGTSDPSGPVRELMNLAESEARHRALTAVIGVPSEFEPRRRQDVDLVFVAANTADARTILPQLSFQRAGSLPVYTTALVYGGGGGVEVDRVRFCDMPWMIDRQGPWRDARLEAENWFSDTAKRQPRLFALGIDAFHVLRQARSVGLQPGERVEGATGRLVLQAGGQFSRELGCVERAENGLNPLPGAPSSVPAASRMASP